MFSAKVGDDCYGDDFSTNKLEQYCKDYFQVEDCIFLTSGTLSNQLAIKSITNPGDEIISHSLYHINFFESSQTSALCNVTLNLCEDDDGFLTKNRIEKALNKKARSPYYAKPKLVWIENSVAATGGKVYEISNLIEISNYCKNNNLHLHLDGARLFNASIASNLSVNQFANLVNSFSICFSKGLGAPFGSMLLGEKEFIDKARKYKKWFGGALHQSGILASSALYGLKNNFSRINKDHAKAKTFAESISKLPLVEVNNPETNIVIFSTKHININSYNFVEKAKDYGLLFFPWTKDSVRVTFHLEISDQMLIIAILKFKELWAEILKLKDNKSVNRHISNY